MASVPIGDLIPTHVESAVFASITDNNRVMQETYAGSIVLQMSNNGGITSRVTYQTFLPVESTTVRLYPGAEIIEWAVLVTPMGFSANEDEQFTCSIDDFKLALKPQSFPGIAGNPLCLVLTFEAALLNGTLHRVGYNVTVQTTRSDTEDREIGEGEVPA